MFGDVGNLYPSLTFADKDISYQSEAHYGAPPSWWALPKNIRLGRKSIAVSNTLAYIDMATITTVKSFKALAPRACIINLLRL